MFGTTNIVKNSDNKKWVYSGYGIAFDGGELWNFGGGFARNVIIFGVDNTLSPHAENRKNNCLVLGEGPTFGISRLTYFTYFMAPIYGWGSAASRLEPLQGDALLFTIHVLVLTFTKTFSINFVEVKTKFRLSLHYNGDNIYLLVSGKKPCNFKADNKDVNFPTKLCLGSISNGFDATESK